MSAEAFKIAKEINSLSISIDQIKHEISQEEGRITFIQTNREERSDELAQFKSTLSDKKAKLLAIENEIAAHQKKLEKDKLALNSVTSNQQLESLEKEIIHMENKLDELENQGLEYLEQTEELENLIHDAETFLNGSKESLAEIQSEVDTFKLENNKKVDQLNHRIELLLNELPPLFKNKVTTVLSKKIAKSSFTRIVNESCEFCRMGLSKIDISNIEDKLEVKSCSGCGRIFIPQRAVH